MKKLTVLFFCITAVAACKKSITGAGENAVQESRCLTNVKGKDITICFDNLEQDSRCPVNADCIWRGIAVANFTLKNGTQEVKFKLANYTLAPFTNDTTINEVRIILKNVTPYPGEAGYSTQKKTAILEIQ
jgi:hypothetical protein